MDGTARGLTRAATAAFVGGALVAAPAIVTAHGLNVQYQSPLPLPVYLAGAAATVGLSFLFVLLRDVRAEQPNPGHLVRVPAPLRIAVRAIGLIGWLWIIVQGIAGGDSDASVATLFLWVYGWVGLAGLSAFVGPLWNWLDPFATLHDLGAALLRTLRIPSWEPAELPPAFRGWPAVVGLFVFIWLELVQRGGPAVLFVVLVAYTGFTLAMMAQFGRDAWRMHGETFSVWFRVLGRLAPFGPVPATETADDPDDVDPMRSTRPSCAAVRSCRGCWSRTGRWPRSCWSPSPRARSCSMGSRRRVRTSTCSAPRNCRWRPCSWSRSWA